MTDNKIHVTLAVYDPRGTYSRHAGVVLASMFSNTQSPVCVHILHDDTLNADNRKKFIELAEKFGQEINFADVGEHIEKLHSRIDVDKLTRGFSRGTLFRLFIQDVLPLDRVIYLDCDVVVELDIKELWEVDLGDCKAAAVPDSLAYGAPTRRGAFFCRYTGMSLGNYFNAGVMLFDLKKVRNGLDICAEISEFFLRCPDTLSPDQDLLNKLFQNSTRPLDVKFNQGQGADGANPKGKLWHCLGKKPWNVPTGRPGDALYWQNFAKTPWCRDLAADMTEAWAASFCTHTHSSDCLRRLWQGLKNDFSPRKHAPFYKVLVIWHDLTYRLKKKFALK